MDLTDHAVLVTGSTRGIGRAIAETLIARGATVGVHGRDPARVESVCAELQTGSPGHAIPIAGDLNEPSAGPELVVRFAARTGRLDGLVNNAGGGRAVAFRGLNLDAWRATFRVNTEAAFLCAREAYVRMRAAGAGSIVNIASLAGHGPGKWMGADYAASKAALVSLTRSLAFEAGRFGIRVNAVSPGMIRTDMTAALPEERRRAVGIPLGRFGAPAEVAQAVLFLLSRAAAYLTGQVLHVDGGLWMGP